jgi:hypothetical protein
MAKINGTLFLLYLFIDNQWQHIGSTTTTSLEITQDTPDATTKDSNGWAENIPGIRSGSGSFGQLYDPTNTLSVTDIFKLISERKTALLKIAKNEIGSEYFQFEANLTNLSMNFDMEQPVGVEGGFNSTGEVKSLIAGS